MFTQRVLLSSFKHLKDQEEVLPHQVDTSMLPCRHIPMKSNTVLQASKLLVWCTVALFSGMALITTNAHASTLLGECQYIIWWVKLKTERIQQKSQQQIEDCKATFVVEKTM